MGSKLTNTHVCVCTELHGQLLAAETEMSNKNKDIQTLRNSLTDAMVSKERLEQRVVEMSQHSMPDDSLQARVQVSNTTWHARKPSWKIDSLIVQLCMLRELIRILFLKCSLCLTGTNE